VSTIVSTRSFVPVASWSCTKVHCPGLVRSRRRSAGLPQLGFDPAFGRLGRLKADAALVFAEPQEKARKGGPRSAPHLEDVYRIIGNVEGPIILVDDVWTMGGHLKAACWKLASPRRSVILACTVAHTTHDHVDKPVDVQEHILDLTRPFF
jgi:hypothetical protein